MTTFFTRRNSTVILAAVGVALAALAASTIAHGQSAKARATQDLLRAVRDGGRTRTAGGREVIDRAVRDALVADALRRGADPNAHYGTDPSPVAAGFRYVARHVAGYKEWDTTLEAHDRLSVLLQAASGGDVGTMRRLLAAGADPKAHGEGGETLLYLVASTRSTEAVQLALDLGADPNEKSGIDLTPERMAKSGRLPLEEAIYSPAVTRLLLSRGANPRLTVRGQALVAYLHDFEAMVIEMRRKEPNRYLTSVDTTVHESIALIDAAAKSPSSI